MTILSVRKVTRSALVMQRRTISKENLTDTEVTRFPIPHRSLKPIILMIFEKVS